MQPSTIRFPITDATRILWEYEEAAAEFNTALGHWFRCDKPPAGPVYDRYQHTRQRYTDLLSQAIGIKCA